MPLAQAAFPRGLSIAGLPVDGLTPSEARSALEQYRLRPLRWPLQLRLGERFVYLDPEEVRLEVHLDEALAQAEETSRHWALDTPGGYLLPLGPWMTETTAGILREDIPLEVEFDEAALRGFLEDLARSYDTLSSSMRLAVLTDTAAIEALGVVSPTWSPGEPALAFLAPRPGHRLDVQGSLAPLEAALKDWRREPIRLKENEVPAPPADVSLLERVLREQIGRMPGVVGIYVRDLESGQEIGVHPGVAFSGASVVKAAIMLQVLRVLDEPPDEEVSATLSLMMVLSDNDAANLMLALAGGGDSSRGAITTTEMLLRLGLHDTCMYSPYQGDSYEGPACLDDPLPGVGVPEGWPATDPDPYRFTTPRDMGLLMAYIYACSRGEGPILEQFPREITADECQAMLELMQQNEDRQRMVAGIPAGIPVAHKSGWIEDMKADAGIVFSPGGTYVLSLFVWEQDWLEDFQGNPRIAALSWLVYTFFNPL